MASCHWQPPKSEGEALQCVRRIPNTITSLLAAPCLNTSHLQLLHYQSHFVESMPVSRPISHKGEQNSNSPQIVGNSIHRQPLSNPAAQITNICPTTSSPHSPAPLPSAQRVVLHCAGICEAHLQVTDKCIIAASISKIEGLKLVSNGHQ